MQSLDAEETRQWRAEQPTPYKSARNLLALAQTLPRQFTITASRMGGCNAAQREICPVVLARILLQPPLLALDSPSWSSQRSFSGPVAAIRGRGFLLYQEPMHQGCGVESCDGHEVLRIDTAEEKTAGKTDIMSTERISVQTLLGRKKEKSLSTSHCTSISTPPGR